MPPPPASIDTPPAPPSMHRYLTSLSLCLSLCLTACIRQVTDAEGTPIADAGASVEQAMATMGNPLLANRGDINAINLSVNSSEELEKIDNGSNEELIWTNPDDPNAEIPGLTQAFENKRSGYGWQNDLNKAIAMARRQELPLIVWFHDSVISPMSKALGEAYLDTPEFSAWCRDRVIRVRLDSGASLDEATAHNAKYSYGRINALQRRYGLKKKPAVAIITPSGKIVARLDGFDGYLSPYINELKDGVARAEKVYAEYKQGFVQRGFREWHARRGGAKVFAKVMRVDEEARVVYLKETGGRVTRTKIEEFCPEDEAYLLSLIKKNTRQPATDEETTL